MDLSECVIVAIPRRYVDPWLERRDRHTTVEDYDSHRHRRVLGGRGR